MTTVDERIAADAEAMGWKFYAEYIRMFGFSEPIVAACISKDDLERREAIAMRCVLERKTATELGLYKPPDGSLII